MVDVTTRGIMPNGGEDAEVLRSLLSDLDKPTVLYFPPGDYHIGSGGTVNIPSNVIIRGAGPDKTHFRLSGDAGGFACYGYNTGSKKNVVESVTAGDNIVQLDDVSGLAVGDIVDIKQNNPHSPDAWAANTWGGVFRITEINSQENTIRLHLPLAIGLDESEFFDEDHGAHKLAGCRNVGFENFHIERTSGPGGAQMFSFIRAYNVFVRNIYSQKSQTNHVNSLRSLGVYVSDSFFDDAWVKTGGHAYGVSPRIRDTEVVVTDNIFKDLRHSLTTQGGANYVIFAYNFIFDTCRERNCSKGEREEIDGRQEADVVVHGNFPHTTLFEGNVFYFSYYDAIHGANGPDIIMFRNKGFGQPSNYWMKGVGVAIEASSESVTLVGNHLLNSSSFKVNGSEDLFTSHNLVDNIDGFGATNSDLPANASLPASLFTQGPPEFWGSELPWPAFGPDVPNSHNNKIPAQIRFESEFQ
ncbi:hypothetical protein SAMN02745866_00683 [Alteromonadaceae bacterium Bs31]|nr:hypothetical protein SAMN02745866_00683 [Alteromonadaceae bacterium Bs31]